MKIRLDLFIFCKHLKACTLAEFVFFGFFQITGGHFLHQFLEADPGFPAEVPLGFGGVAQKGFHFRGPEIAGVDPDDGFSIGHVDATFVDALAFPGDGHAQFPGADFHEFPHGMLFSCGDDVIVGPVLLEHQPLHFHVIPGMAPVPQGAQVAEVQAVLKA